MKKTILKRAAALLLAALAAAGLAACGKQPEPDTLRIGVMYSSDIIPLAVMKDQKLDEKQGVVLDMQVFSSAKDRDAALQAGELDGVFTDFIGACIYQNAGLDVKITGMTDGDYLLLAGPDSGVTTLADAAGKSIAISENTLIEYALDYILTQEGYGADYLKKEVVPRIPDRLEMLRSGEVDLCLLPEPFATLALTDGAVELGSANTAGLYPAVSAFTQSAIDGKAGAIRKYYAAYDEAVDYVNNTPLSEYEPVVIAGAGFPEELAGRIELPVFRKNALPDAAVLSDAVAWASGKGLCPASLTPADLLGDLG
ncbi:MULTISPECIES: ABC transporter substrate-binding protein [Anaerotruncus]|mgnify:CR=1 FL=1|uniref:ABC transporter substrate-binding protein n=1 Tax=Anaerotruncus TaxID=244127 RepID=UPI00208CE282|nr:MetQ/NlpA family ABC transporter substrate-binding protein [Anaerotruncus massiliensis (ex Togo et al. 2019)]GKH47484.1 metal ABC transporter substrate-binding protein [Oscillospiraceae bacterium]